MRNKMKILSIGKWNTKISGETDLEVNGDVNLKNNGFDIGFLYLRTKIW